MYKKNICNVFLFYFIYHLLNIILNIYLLKLYLFLPISFVTVRLGYFAAHLFYFSFIPPHFDLHHGGSVLFPARSAAELLIISLTAGCCRLFIEGAVYSLRQTPYYHCFFLFVRLRVLIYCSQKRGLRCER